MDVAYPLAGANPSVLIGLDDPDPVMDFATNDFNFTPIIDPTILIEVPAHEPPTTTDDTAVDDPDPPIDPEDDSIVPFSAHMTATDDVSDQFFFGTKAQSHAAPVVTNFDAGADQITLDHHFYADANLIAYHDGELSYDGKVIAHFDGAPDITPDLISII